jgi:photosystem II stability/assembly factor-like uncharacterized protein
MGSSRSLVVLLFALCWSISLPVSAEPTGVEPLIKPLHWRSIGPFRGGRVLTVTGVPGEPHHFYFGAVNGGVWETRDAGRTWDPIFDSAPVGSIGALAVAPSDPKVIYVGTGEADMRSDIAQGAGLYRSSDAGRSWQPIGLADSQQIGRILVDPTDPNLVLVAALGHPYGPNEVRGVFRSSDGGKTWQRTLYKDANTGAIDLTFEPGNPKVVYAALWQTRRPPWNVYPPSSGPGGGLYKSTDGGQTWGALAGHGLPQKVGRIGIAVAPSRPQRVLALVDADEGGLYVSEDAGASWTRTNGDRRIWGRGWYFQGVTVDPRNADDIYICNTAVYRSQDGGQHFVPIKGAPGGDDYHQLWIDPQDPQRRILGVDQGAVVTLDGGSTWSSWYNQNTAQFYHVITDNRFPYWVYGAQQDSGAAGVPSRTDNIDGVNLRQFQEVTAGGESDNIAPDPDDPEVIFGGRVDKLDLRTGQTESVPPTLAYPDIYRGTWTLPLVFGTGHALYFGSQRVFRTTDGGKHWDAISPDLTREAPAIPRTLDSPTIEDNLHGGQRRGVVYAIGPSPLDSRLLWAGTDDGLVWKSRDAGGHWQDVTPKQLTAWSKVGVVEPSHFDAAGAYLAIDRHRLDDPRPYLYRTHDGGSTWTLITAGIADQPILNSVNVVREDPVKKGLLYCGTERGVYVSLDDGEHWLPLQQNLPRTSVRDLQVHGDDLVIATHGRGFWIMDDVALLRSLAADAGTSTRLLPPALAYRVRPTGFTGTPLPKDEPMGTNPPLGASIDYVLDAVASGPVKLSIFDAQGKPVRSFSSDDKADKPDLAQIPIAPEWIAPPERPGKGTGAHRFVWDLHYAAPQPSLTSEEDEEEPGVWAPPGRYRIELTVNDHRYEQSLTVLPDPRVKLPETAYAQEFELARQVERDRVEITQALGEAMKIHAALAERARKSRGQVASALAAADKQLMAVTDVPEQGGFGVAPKTTAGLRYLSGAFSALARAIDGADAAPTPDAQEGYTRHAALLSRALSEWATFKATALPALNEQLKAAGQAPIAVAGPSNPPATG